MIGLRLLQIATFILLSSVGARAADWVSHEQNLRGLEGQIRSLRAEITTKIQESSLSADPSTKKSLMAEIVRLEEELRGETEKMSAELRHIKYEHPERGQDFKSLAVDFNLDLPAHLPSTPQLEKLLAESKELLQKVYGLDFSKARDLASETQGPGAPAPARWVLEK